jgi:leader peptidase (prepilin peptidase) / N-methyltransferase
MTLATVTVLLAAPFVGSFLGVVTDRLPAGLPVVRGRSRCDACGATLGAKDLVPVVSWLWQRGRCAYCRAELSPFYPAIELAALAVALSAAWVLSGWLLLVSLALGWTLLTLAAIDQRHFLLPDALTLPLIPAGLAVAFAIDPALVVPHLLGALAGFAAFAAIGVVYRRLRGREGLGLGDAKLLAAAGAWLGWQALPGLVVIAALCALALALARALTGDRVSATTRIAFGSYLALAFWLVWLLGPPILA